MRRFFERLCTKTGRRLLALGQGRSVDVFSGCINVAGLKVTNLRPLGGYHQPGVTKAGRLSFAGLCEGRKVKVYSSHSAAQNALRKEVQSIDFGVCAFPELLGVDEHLVVEAWVEGMPVSTLKGTERHKCEQAILSFFENNSVREDLLSVAARHRHAFCYLQNYLTTRLGVWEHWDPVGTFVSEWRERYAELKEILPVYLTHPDLSAANLVREARTDRIFIIDNELLGVGHGWTLDGRNSLLQADVSSVLSKHAPGDFVEMCWRLRLLGSALDANDFFRVKALCDARSGTI